MYLFETNEAELLCGTCGEHGHLGWECDEPAALEMETDEKTERRLFILPEHPATYMWPDGRVSAGWTTAPSFIKLTLDAVDQQRGDMNVHHWMSRAVAQVEVGA